MKKYRLAGIITAVLLVLVAAVADRSGSRVRLTGVCDVIQHEDTLYILDNQGDSYQLFASGTDGVLKGQIVLPKLEGNWWNSYSSLSVDTDGSVYLYYYGKTMDLGESRSAVYRCDFEKGSLIFQWELPAEKMIRIQVTDGAVCYLASDSGGKAVFYRQDKQGEIQCLFQPAVEYNQVKGFGWNQEKGFLWMDWNCAFHRNGYQIEDGTETQDFVNVCMDHNGISYTDMTTETVMYQGWDQKVPKERFRIEDVKIWNQKLEYLDLLPFRYNTDGSWLAGVDLEPESRCLGIFDASGKQVSQLEYLVRPLWDRILHAGRAVCLCLALAGTGIGLMKLMLHYTGGMVPILVQLLGVLIPVVLSGSLLLNHQIRSALEQRLIKTEYDFLYVIANQQIRGMDPMELLAVDLWNIPQDPHYRKLFRQRSYSSLAKSIFEDGKKGGELVTANTYSWIFLEKNKDLRYLEVSDRHCFGTRVSYDRGRPEIKKMQEAMEQQHVVKSEYNDFAGSFIVLYVPVITEAGKSIGVMECGMNRRILIYEIARWMKQINGGLMVLNAVLILTFILVLSYFLYPLGRVRKAVEDLNGGNLGRMVTVRGRDEVAEIARAFNRMSCRLKEQMEYTRLCAERYAAFVPQKVFEILERSDITKVELGDQREIAAAILHVGSHQFEKMARQMNGGELYGMINRTLQEMIPIIMAQQGVVERMAGDKLTAYYPGGGREALITAVSICEKMNLLAGGELPVPLYHAVIHAGKIRVGIIGWQERMEAATISEVMTLASFLQGMAEKYGVRILVTESAAKQIPDFSVRFHVRMIGYLRVQMSQSLEAVYDVYDGDDEEQRSAKKATAEQFAKGLGYYFAQQYYEARLEFVGVLRRNPKDLAARAYVYRCDAYNQSEEKHAMQVWLEQY